MRSKLPFLIVTGLAILALLPGAIMDIVQPDMMVEIVEGLGLPLPMLTLIGIWKLLGIVAMCRPQWTRVSEWAYAGFFFDLTGAAWVHGTAGDLAGIAPPLVVLGLVLASYRLRPVAETDELKPAAS